MDLPSHLNMVDCATKVIPINDDNYRSVIDWFKACLQLSRSVSPANRDDYELSVIGNVKNSLADFFQHTELSLSTLVGLEREVTAMFHGIGPPVAPKSKLSSEPLNDSEDGTCDDVSPEPDESLSADDELSEAIKALYRRFLWVAIASIILLILLILVLATLCWLKNYIEKDIKEIFITCPSKEDLQDDKNTKRSSGGPGMTREPTMEAPAMRSMSKRPTSPSFGSPPPDDEVEPPHEEDEEYVDEYGNEPPYAYPVRVWMTPLARKRQPGKPTKCTAKKNRKK